MFELTYWFIFILYLIQYHAYALPQVCVCSQGITSKQRPIAEECHNLTWNVRIMC